MVNKNKILILGFVLVFILVFILRFIALDMDPTTVDDYGTGWADEGAYIHNAKNKVLFGQWELENDLWNPIYISPTFTFFQYLSFSALGVSTFSSRLVPAILGILSILFISVILMSKNKEQGIIYFILLGLNIMLIAFSRVAMLESAILFFIVIILGFIIQDKKYSWFFVGFFISFLIFTKLTSMFFIFAIPLSLLIYSFIYKSKPALKKFFLLVFGGITSMTLWMLWLIPNFISWKFMNFGSYGGRIYFTIYKLLSVPLFVLKFSLLNQLVIILVIISIFFTFRVIKRREKISYLDFLLIVILIMFFLQTLVTDYPLRRFVLIVPIILLIATRFIYKIKKINYSENIKVKGKTLVVIILLLYIIINLGYLGLHFGQLKPGSREGYRLIDAAKEVPNYIPDYEKVYGRHSHTLSLESKIKPYFGYRGITYANTESHILPFLENGEINYAILAVNVFDESDIINEKIFFEEQPAYTYIRDNFEIIKTLNGKDHRTNSLYFKFHIYKRKLI